MSRKPTYLRIKKDIIFSFLLTAIVSFILQYIILTPHLRYGFADVDWQSLMIYIQSRNPLSLTGFSYIWHVYGAYASTAYYMGLQYIFFGIHYVPYEIVSFIVKYLSAISVFPFIYLISKRKLVAAIATITYSIHFSTVGGLYTISSTVDYIGYVILSIFLCIYWYVGKNNLFNWKWAIAIIITFYTSLFLATVRIYPLLPLLVVGEILYWSRNNFSKPIVASGLKRLSSLILPLCIVLIFDPSAIGTVVNGFIANITIIFTKIKQGNWHLFLNPLASLGSMLVPQQYQIPIGTNNLEVLKSYVEFLCTWPLIVFGLSTIGISFLITKAKIKFILITLGIFYVLSFIAFILYMHNIHTNTPSMIHVDPTYVMPMVLQGFFLIGLCISIFWIWQKRLSANSLLLPLFLGMSASFLIVFLTWVPSDVSIYFVGIHRYLTLPSLGLSISFAVLLVLIFDKLKSLLSVRNYALLVFLVLIPLFFIYSGTITNYFQNELYVTGMDATAHSAMKGTILSYLSKGLQTQPELVYFDESQDIKNGYFDETTALAGFPFWAMFRNNTVAPITATPFLLRSYYFCGNDIATCIVKLKKDIVIMHGEKGFLVNNNYMSSHLFYSIHNFYAFRFKNKRVYDIRSEVLAQLHVD